MAALLAEATTLDEYAFAIGALSHYVADNDGHPIAVNRGVPLIYPKLEAKYGPQVTFEENPAAHLKTEFGFDVVQVAQGRYRPDAYRDFIGFEVSRPLLERAFLRTYGLRFNEVFADLDLSIGTFRRTVSTVVPAMTKVAWEMKGREIARRDPAVTADRFIFALSRSEYEQRWGRQYERPNTGEKFLAVLLRVVPKVGPFKALAFKSPTPEAERLFLRSLTISIDRYREALSTLPRRRLALDNLNLDLGQPVHAGAYRLADQAYARWLDRLAHDHFEGVSPEIRSNLLSFYKNGDALADLNPHRSAWKRTARQLDELKSRKAVSR